MCQLVCYNLTEHKLIKCTLLINTLTATRNYVFADLQWFKFLAFYSDVQVHSSDTCLRQPSYSLRYQEYILTQDPTTWQSLTIRYLWALKIQIKLPQDSFLAIFTVFATQTTGSPPLTIKAEEASSFFAANRQEWIVGEERQTFLLWDGNVTL